MNISVVMLVGVFICLAVSSRAYDDNTGRMEVDFTTGNKGAAALAKLLKGAEFYTIQRGYSLYVKKGKKYKDALRDFRSVDPVNVKERTNAAGARHKSLVGLAGDRKVNIMPPTGNDRGTLQYTAITVSAKGDELPWKILYK